MSRKRTSETWEFYPFWITPNLPGQETPPKGLDTCEDFGLLLERLENIFIANITKARGPKERKDLFKMLLRKILQSLRELTKGQDVTDFKREAVFSLFKAIDAFTYNAVLIKTVEVHDRQMDALKIALEAKTHFVFPGLPKEYILQPVPGRPGKYGKDHELLTNKRDELERRRQVVNPQLVLVEVEKDRGKKFKEPYRTQMFNAWQKRVTRAAHYINDLRSARRKVRGTD